MTQKTVTITSVRFLDDDIFEGSIDSQCYEDARVDIHHVDSVRDAADIIRREGLEFEECNRHATNPDGSYISDYRTGENCEVTASVEGFTRSQLSKLHKLVNTGKK